MQSRHRRTWRQRRIKMIPEHSHCKNCGRVIELNKQRKVENDYFPDFCEKCFKILIN